MVNLIQIKLFVQEFSGKVVFLKNLNSFVDLLLDQGPDLYKKYI